jgi:obg-like ATPase 1
VDPLRDLDIIYEELIAKDLQFIEKKKEEVDKVIKRTNAKPAQDEMKVLVKSEDYMKERKYVKDGEWAPREIEILN